MCGRSEHSRLAPLPAHPLLHERAHDLLRALRLADERQHLRVRLLSVANPARTRAREHGQLALAALALLELPRMFEERDVPCESRVEDVLEAEHVPAEYSDAVEDLGQVDGVGAA